MNNVLYIDKPSGISSFDVCYKLRKIFNTKRIGHTGTLDPNASGVMIILIDQATKINQFLISDSKQYIARIKLGIQTDTLDIDGNIINEKDYIMPSKEEIVEVLNSFLGKGKQEVPITSAKKIDGKKLYLYQLHNEDVQLPIIDIEISKIQLLDMYDDGFSFMCDVSSGTYIRALARDILEKLNLIGTLSSLRRTRIDNVSIEQCYKLDEVLNGKYILNDIYDVLSSRYSIFQTNNVEDIKNGKRIKIESDENTILVCHDKQVLAVYTKDGNEYKSVRGLW